jgi:hypothetical protein
MENRCDSDGGSTLHMEIVTIMRKRQNGAMKPRLGEGGPRSSDSERRDRPQGNESEPSR